jgi:hypothetical protein
MEGVQWIKLGEDGGPSLNSYESSGWLICRSLMRPISTTRGSVVGTGTMLQAGRSRVQFPKRLLDFFQLT